MRKEFPSLRFVLGALCALSLFAVRAHGQERVFGRERVFSEERSLGQEKRSLVENPALVERPNGIAQDWSHRHVLYPRVGEIHALIAVQNDPRAIQSWQAAARRDWIRWGNFSRFDHRRHDAIHLDWNISLGTGSTAPAMYPAKYTFDPNAAPDCTNDFAVFPVNATGSSTQPNIVGLNNLYSGTGGSVGICNRGPTASDDGVSATDFWSYDIKAAGGQVPTSPALSLDGTKVAFVESSSGTTAHFHTLAWSSLDGLDAADKQNVLKPKVITSGFSATAPAAGSGAVTDLALNTGTTQSDTLSSPFVDLRNDKAYLGNDSGVLFRIKNVFCNPNVDACVAGVSAAPSLDSSWGTGGALTIGGTCTGKLTGPVVDGGTGNVFVGCADGKLYGFTSAGVALTGSPLTVGNGGTTGGIVDPPTIDAVNGFVYTYAGNSSGGTAVVVQASTSNLSSPAPVTAKLGVGGSFNLHAPAFNDAYFSSGTVASWILYEVGLADSGNPGRSALWGITFGAGHVMTSGVPTNEQVFIAAVGTDEFSPVTEFNSTAAPAEDRIFESALASFAGNVASFNVTSGFPAGLEHFFSAGAQGTSGIVVDNGSASNQADSMYYSDPGNSTAVKLTQSTLQ